MSKQLIQVSKLDFQPCYFAIHLSDGETEREGRHVRGVSCFADTTTLSGAVFVPPYASIDLLRYGIAALLVERGEAAG